MRNIIVGEKIILYQGKETHSEDAFNLIQKNKDRLAPYLSWVSSLNNIEAQKDFYKQAQNSCFKHFVGMIAI